MNDLVIWIGQTSGHFVSIKTSSFIPKEVKTWRIQHGGTLESPFITSLVGTVTTIFVCLFVVILRQVPGAYAMDKAALNSQRSPSTNFGTLYAKLLVRCNKAIPTFKYIYQVQTSRLLWVLKYHSEQKSISMWNYSNEEKKQWIKNWSCWSCPATAFNGAMRKITL